MAVEFIYPDSEATSVFKNGKYVGDIHFSDGKVFFIPHKSSASFSMEEVAHIFYFMQEKENKRNVEHTAN